MPRSVAVASPMSPLARAQALLELRRFVEAERVLRSHLASAPDDSEALTLLALALLEQDRLDDARQVAEQVVRLSPDEGPGFVLLADVRRRQGQHELAQEAASAAVRAAPEDWTARYTRAHVLLTQRDPDPAAALSDALQGVRLAPDESEAHNMLGMSYAALGRVDAATDAYQAALQLDPTNAWVLNNLAVLGLTRGRLSPAARDLRSGLAHAPEITLLQENFDVLLLRLFARGFSFVVPLAVLETVLAWTSAARSARVVACAVGFFLLAAAAVVAFRRLPRGSGPIARGLWARSPSRVRVLLVVWSIGELLTLVVGLAPIAVARPAGLLFAALLSWLVVVGVVSRARR